MAYHNNPKIITNGLVLYLDAANSKSYPGSGTVWTDLSRRGNNATLINGPTFNSANKGAIVFDGTNDYASVSSFASNFNGPFSLCITFYQTSNSVSQTFFSTYNSVSNDGVFMQINSASEGSGLRMTYRQLGANIFNFTQTEAILLNTFYNVVCTYDGANAYTYYNGVRQSVSASASSYFTSVNSTLFINTITEIDRFFTGNVYQISIYNKALNSKEILQNYNAVKGRFKL